jgi:IS5 family transposase
VALDEPTPDHNTLWRFREELARHGLAARLLAAVNAQLAEKGMILRQGTLIDATLVQASVAAANRRKDGSPVDPEARPPRSPDLGPSGDGASASCGCWTKRGRRSLQGYKAHVAVDRGSGLVRRLDLTGADLHDSRKGGDLIQGDEAAVCADPPRTCCARSLRESDRWPPDHRWPTTPRASATASARPAPPIG